MSQRRIVFHIILFSLIFYSECINKYCNSNVCKNTNEHTLCKFKSPGPAAHCLNYEKTIEESDRLSILAKINERRNKLAAGGIRSLPPAENMLEMEWSDELELSAQRWADQCVTHRHSVGDIQDMCRDLDGVAVGQNIATIYGDAPGLTPSALVDVWYMELLNINSSILYKYQPSNELGFLHFEYFTQLLWAASNQVGCGGVKFYEKFNGEDNEKNRTVYRLVCNFAPKGNRVGSAVYSAGLSGSKCIFGTSESYKALCKPKPPELRKSLAQRLSEQENNERYLKQSKVELGTKDYNGSLLLHGGSGGSGGNKTLTTTHFVQEDDNSTLFDYFSHLYEFTKHLPSTTTSGRLCKNNIADIDEIVDLLKKKLGNELTVKESKLSITASSTESTYTDASVSAFLNRIYSKKMFATTPLPLRNDIVNSTLLVDLVEAVIFRNGEIKRTEEAKHDIQPVTAVSPVKIHAEIGARRPNYEMTGHYFFPEDDKEESVNDSSESYYDTSDQPEVSDVVLEIEKMRKSIPTRDFLDDIFESETDIASEQRSTDMHLLSPDDLNVHKSGYNNMKKFLKDITEETLNGRNDQDTVKMVDLVKYN